MAAGFFIVRDDRNKGTSLLAVSSFTGAVGDLIERVAGSATWAACTATSNHFTRKAIITKAVTSASTVEAIELDGTELILAQCANNSAAADNGDLMILTDTNTVNNTGTTSTAQAATISQEGVVGAAADKTILVRVMVGSGVDPDAA